MYIFTCILFQHVVEKIVSREMAKKYLQYDIKEFVETNPNMKWCPSAGCGQAVKKPVQEYDSAVLMGDDRDEQSKCLFVHCGKDHYFCWFVVMSIPLLVCEHVPLQVLW